MSLDEEKLTRSLGSFAQARGADLFGAADLSPARDFLIRRGRFPLDSFPRAISLGMALCDDIVDGHRPEEDRRASLYWHHVYDVVSPALNFLAYDVCRWLAARGFRVLPVPASMPYDQEKLEGILSHKLAAHLAGLGWIGKSCLLLTERFGPRARFVSVLTDAPLSTGSPLDDPCGACRVCVDSCPVGAFSGVEFRPSDERESRFDAGKCRDFRVKHACGRCVSSCPRGRRKKSESRQ